MAGSLTKLRTSNPLQVQSLAEAGVRRCLEARGPSGEGCREPVALRLRHGTSRWARCLPRYRLVKYTTTVCGLFVAPVAQTVIRPL
jgi:hypothetical protein